VKFLRELALGASIGFLVLLLAMVVSLKAHAGMLTEIGGGLKVATSNVLDPACRQVFIVDADHSLMFDELNRQKTVPCGGRNPIFIGWPIAWETPNGNTRLGWFHMSHWSDGPPFNHHGETAFNCICATHKFYWSRR